MRSRHATKRQLNQQLTVAMAFASSQAIACMLDANNEPVMNVVIVIKGKHYVNKYRKAKVNTNE
jgi:hypothetical protein